MGTDSVVDLLHLSYKRHDIIRLISDGTLDKRAVEAAIDSSRPTLDRAYRELEGAGIITSTGTSYELTNFGELFCQEFVRTWDAFGTLTEVRDVLSYLPRDAAIDMRLLEDAAIHQAEEHAPQEPLMEVVDIALTSDEIKGYSSTLNPYYVDVFYRLVVDDGVPVTLVFTEDVVDAIRTNYSEKFDDILRADHARIYSTPEVKTYGLIMGDGTVAVPVGDERDHLQAVIVNETDAAVEWGDDYLESLAGSPEATEL